MYDSCLHSIRILYILFVVFFFCFFLNVFCIIFYLSVFGGLQKIIGLSYFSKENVRASLMYYIVLETMKYQSAC